MLVKAMDAAHREYSQVIQCEHTRKAVVATVQKKSSRGRSHSVNAFDTRQHHADHSGRERSAQPNWQSGSPATRGGRGSSGASASRGNGRSTSQGRSNPGHAEEPSDKNLACELFTKIGNLFGESDPDLLIPGIQNMAYKNNQKTLSQYRKDLERISEGETAFYAWLASTRRRFATCSNPSRQTRRRVKWPTASWQSGIHDGARTSNRKLIRGYPSRGMPLNRSFIRI